jgi:hypothetical protein
MGLKQERLAAAVVISTSKHEVKLHKRVQRLEGKRRGRGGGDGDGDQSESQQQQQREEEVEEKELLRKEVQMRRKEAEAVAALEKQINTMASGGTDGLAVKETGNDLEEDGDEEGAVVTKTTKKNPKKEESLLPPPPPLDEDLLSQLGPAALDSIAAKTTNRQHKDQV